MYKTWYINSGINHQPQLVSLTDFERIINSIIGEIKKNGKFTLFRDHHSIATLRCPGLKVKLLVGPTFVKSHDQLKGANVQE